MGAPIHDELIGLSEEDLLKLAPDATHQHYKGGLYRDLGQLGVSQLRAYIHCYPHNKEAWTRNQKEFHSDHEGHPRFRRLNSANSAIINQRIDHGRLKDADTGGDYLINGKSCRLVTHSGHAFAEQDKI